MFRYNSPNSRWLIFCFGAAISGCAAVGPNYVSPKLSPANVPTQWTSSTGAPVKDAAGPASVVANTSWWRELSDPVLDQLVADAFSSSPTLEAAAAKLQVSRSAYVQANSSGLPSVDGGATSDLTSGSSSGKGISQSWLSLNAAWELDFFGAVRRGKEGALARQAVQEATLADARVSLAADVTDAYLSYRACQSYAALSAQDVTSRMATQKLTAASVKEGFTAPYQAIRSKASVAEARTGLAGTKAYCERLENQLTRLTGFSRPELMKVLAIQPTGLARLPVPKRFSIAIPSQALMQRPDMRAAERTLAAASADIGLAEADRYPRISLNGQLGYSTTGASAIGTLSLGAWSLGPSVSLPIFDGGRRQAAVEIAKARYDQAYADLKATARRAIQEIEDGLTRYAAANERAENARLSANDYQHYFDSVEVRFREGASNLLELEDARRAMLSAQQTLLSVYQERLQAWVTLNRATGGGAQYDADAPAPAGLPPEVAQAVPNE